MLNLKRPAGWTILAAASLGVLATRANAAAPPPYAAADLAYSSIGLKASGFEGNGVQSRSSDRSDVGYALTLGWRFSPYLAAEAALLHLGEGKYDVTIQDGTDTADGTVGVRSRGALLALAASWPIDDRWSIEGRAGAYLGKTETRVSGEMTTPFGNQAFSTLIDSDSSTGVAAGAAVLAAFNETWAVRLGYDYLDEAFGENASRVSLGVRFNWP